MLAKLALLVFLAAAAPARADDSATAPSPSRSPQEILAEREERKTIYAGLEKSETLAFMLSVVPGGGAGCFYSGAYDMGWIFFGTELGVIGVTALTASNLSLSAIQAEGIIFGLLKIGEMVACTISAANFNDDLHRAYEEGNRRRGLTLAPGPDPVHPSIVAGYSFRF